MNNVRPCPICATELLRPAPDVAICTGCGWRAPSVWFALDLLDQARNHVQDAALRARITHLIPPQPRDWPAGIRRFEVHS